MMRAVRARAVALAMADENEHTTSHGTEPPVPPKTEEANEPQVDDVELAPEHEMLRGHVRLNGEDFLAFPKDYVPVAESIHELFKLNTMDFEGPLDLLLFLIKRHKLDIFDIPISFLSEKYLDAMKTMEELDIDVAAEFLAMAAELAHIKSKMLLPPDDEDDEEEEERDPRAELVRRLLEYQKYKDAADQLGNLEQTGRDVFKRPPEFVSAAQREGGLKEVGVFSLVASFDQILQQRRREHKHQVRLDSISLRDRIIEMSTLLARRPNTPFRELVSAIDSRLDLIVTFLAVLEMAKMRLMRVFQSEDGTLYLRPRFEDPEEVHERLKGLDESQYA